MLDKDGLITEVSSRRYGKKPLDNPKRERFLSIAKWFCMLIPIAGIVLFVMMSEELTDDYGHQDWCG